MTLDTQDFAATVRGLGRELTPQAMEASLALYAPCHEREPYAGVRLTRDLAYGADERHRLDLFAPEAAGAARPILLFVHGGGFVGGDKRRPGSPYQDNVALWAVRHGMIGINMTYRLAPLHPWPAGAEDVGAAVAWAMRHAGEHGGDPDRIFVMGTSAGAVHVASYIAHPRFHPPRRPAAAGALLLSGIYDIATAERNQRLRLYFGADEAVYRAASALPGLVETPVPLLVAIAECEPPDFERQALQFLGAHAARHGRWPWFLRLMGHNHYTATLHLNSGDDWFGQQILGFMGAHGARP